MGNQIQKFCRNCIKLQSDEFRSQTQFIQIADNLTKLQKTKKFFLSSQAVTKQKINQLIIFTDSTLTMSIPNFNLKFTDDDLQKLYQTIKYEIYNNKITIKENCFLLNVIQEELESQYGEFKEFLQAPSIANKAQSINISQVTGNSLQKLQTLKKSQKLKNQIEQFALRNISRALRFKNPLKKYSFGQIIVAIVPIYQKIKDIQKLKQAVEQALSMCQDLKTVGMGQISFMLGYQISVFQKMVLDYLLGYSKSKKKYVFKRINQFVYLTKSNEKIDNFIKLLNKYSITKLQRAQNGKQNLHQNNQSPNLRKLGNNSDIKKTAIFNYKSQNNSQSKKLQIATIFENNNLNKKSQTERQANQNYPQANENIKRNPEYLLSNPQDKSFSNQISISNTSFHSYKDGNNFFAFKCQKINAPSNQNFSIKSYCNDFGKNSHINDSCELNQRSLQNIQIQGLKLKSFKSNQSNVSDYF